MAENRENYQVPGCRLCLSDKFDTLKPIFSNELGPNSIPQKIQQLLLIQVQKEDKLSTLICNECIIRLDTWQSYKTQCCRNQIKLLEFYNKKIKTETLLEMNMSVKTELEDFESSDTDEVTLNETAMLPVKVEVDENTGTKTYSELPPILTPNNMGPIDKSINHAIASNTLQTDENKTCPECGRTFCSVYSMKRHKKVIHKKKRSKSNKLSKASLIIDNSNLTNRFQNELANTSFDSTNDFMKYESPQISQCNNDSNESIEMEIDQNLLNNQSAEQQPVRNLSPLEEKVQFAAVLKLTQKHPLGTILSKVELSYMEKCRAMVSMFNTHKCACHNVQYNSLRNLLSHLKQVKSWFPLFTCYSCMISFTDRSAFTVHYGKCPRSSLETLKKLSNLKRRSENKIRLYQNFKCNLCRFVYSFYDDFCRHVSDEHVIGEAPFNCSCQRQFDTAEDYKNHCIKSCVLSYYCDICYSTSFTIDEFLKHCLENHDASEGFTLLQKSNAVRKSWPNRETVDAANMVYGKRDRKKSVKLPNSKEVSGEKTHISPSLVRKLLNMEERRSGVEWKQPAVCPYCNKLFSSAHNMARHYRIHLEKNEVPLTPVVSTRQDESFYSCPDCPGMFKSSEWKTHLEKYHPPKNCIDCNKVFRFQSELDEHKKSHLSVTLYRDSKTNSYKITPSPEAEASKNKKLPREVMVSCDICDIMFTNKDDLKKHKQLCHKTFNNFTISTETLETTTHSETDLPILEPIIDIEEAKDKQGNILSVSLPTTLISCDECGKEYSTKKSLKQHKRNKHGLNRDIQFPKKCDYCDKMCSTGASLYLHTQMHERRNDPPVTIPLKRSKPEKMQNIKLEDLDFEDAPSVEESYYTCNRCFKVFASKFKLKKHMSSHGNQKKSPKLLDKTTKISCGICHISVDNKAALKQHKIDKHRLNLDTKDKAFKCPSCPKLFKTLAAMSTHSGWHTRNGTKVDSPVPNTPQANAAAKLIKHTKILSKISGNVKTETKEFECTTCLLRFGNETALQIHILQKHRDIDAKMLVPHCATCNEDFKTQTAYDIHKRYHNLLERQHQQFPENQDTSSLEKNKPYVCKLCNISFSRWNVLKAHEKLYHELACENCPAVFLKRSSLNAHAKTHTTQRKKSNSRNGYSCSICKASFSYRNELVTHTVNEHPF